MHKIASKRYKALIILIKKWNLILACYLKNKKMEYWKWNFKQTSRAILNNIRFNVPG